MSDLDVITAGVLAEADLLIVRGVDNDFDLEWEDELGEPVLIVSATGTVTDRETGLTYLDLDPYISVDANVVSVSVPASVTADLSDLAYGKWHVIATDEGGGVRALTRGHASAEAL